MKKPLAMYNLEELWNKVSLLLTDLVMKDKLTQAEALYISFVLGTPKREGAKSVTMLVDENEGVHLTFSDEAGVPLTELINFMKVSDG